MLMVFWFPQVKIGLRRERAPDGGSGATTMCHGDGGAPADMGGAVDQSSGAPTTPRSMNLQLLKWSSEFGIHASWKMLSGIPGESDSWYAEMAKWLPAIFHLQPSSGVNRVRYDRFSPYQMCAQDFVPCARAESSLCVRLSFAQRIADVACVLV